MQSIREGSAEVVLGIMLNALFTDVFQPVQEICCTGSL